jgi:hypothetical protein
MKQEIKQQLLNCFNNNKEILFELTFNTNHLFYCEPQDFNDYLDLINDLKESTLLTIIKNFNS